MANDMRESKFQKRVEETLARAGIHFERPNGDGLPDLLLCIQNIKMFVLLELKASWGATTNRDAYDALRGTQKFTVLEWGRLGFPVYELLETSRDGKVALIHGAELQLVNHHIALRHVPLETAIGAIYLQCSSHLISSQQSIVSTQVAAPSSLQVLPAQESPSSLNT